ncbi:MAG: dihydroorotate dehydrogenase [Defluviitaleaceae bacterium]|nr:dihydroorotate dehydrogenase [Defluviitaleaceae bacterium]
MNRNLSVNLAGVNLKNPIATASGTFGSGREYSQFVDLNHLGAVTVKGISHEPWEGNPPHRIAETHGGMLNAIGLQNPGAKDFIAYELPFLRQFDTKIIVNLCGRDIDDYIAVTEDFADTKIDIFELNISCPNVKTGLSMGTDSKAAEAVTKAVVARANAPVIVKLSPNVTDIVSIAKACEAGGAAGISLINSVLGMKIDIRKKMPLLGNTMGGLSGPAIKPIALRMVYQVARNVDLPILGMGGIMNWEDAIEFIMAGATAVAVGMANFTNPCVTMDILEGIENYMEQEGITDINQLRGIAW